MVFLPGAALEVIINTSSRLQQLDDAHSARAATRVQLTYLRSYEGQGIVSVVCTHACSCKEQRINAHRPARRSYENGGRNESVFSQYDWTVVGRTPNCGVRLTVLNQSTSGAHAFKVRTIVVMSGDHKAAGV